MLNLTIKSLLDSFTLREIKLLSLNAERIAIHFKAKKRKHFELFHKKLYRLNKKSGTDCLSDYTMLHFCGFITLIQNYDFSNENNWKFVVFRDWSIIL